MFRAPIVKPRCLLTARPRAARRLHVYGAPIDIHPEVQEALGAKKPVVALETTLITSGLPWPTNLNVANELESIVRETGCVPATIGIIGGRVKVGLEPRELERLANYPEHGRATKISRRDIAPVIANQGDGGTTCSATLIFAALAGIKVFATGGLGGVHRGGELTMDVSADLFELTRCPVGLVSAGVKSILDIGRTLEYLETLGVPVLPYGTNEFPAFFTRHSGHMLPWKIDDAATAAKILHTQKLLNMSMGALFAVPIPEKYEAAGAEIQKAVEQAIQESEENGISKRGKEVTPWLLNRVSELSGGNSMENNLALLRNTALVGGNIAMEYSKLVTDSIPPNANVLSVHNVAKNTPIIETNTTAKPPKADIIVAGAAAVDITAQVTSNEKGQHSTSPGTVSISLGGVGRNIAEAAHRASSELRGEKTTPSSVLLVSAVGDDLFARLLKDEMVRMNMRTDGLVTADGKTAVCNMLLNAQGDLMNGVAAMEVVERLPAGKILAYIDENAPSVVCLDGNLSAENLTEVVNHSHKNGSSHILFEPTSITKSARILPAITSNLHRIDSSKSCIAFSTPNLLELAHIYQCCTNDELTSTTEWWDTIDAFSLGGNLRNELDLLSRLPVSEDDPAKGTLSFLVTEGVAQMAINLLPFFQHLFIKCGSSGAILVMRLPSQDMAASAWSVESSNIRTRRVVSKAPSGEMVIIQHFPPIPVKGDYVINVTGAGDSFVGSVLAGLSKYGSKAFQNPSLATTLMEEAQTAAVLTLGSAKSVSPLIGQ